MRSCVRSLIVGGLVAGMGGGVAVSAEASTVYNHGSITEASSAGGTTQHGDCNFSAGHLKAGVKDYRFVEKVSDLPAGGLADLNQFLTANGLPEVDSAATYVATDAEMNVVTMNSDRQVLQTLPLGGIAITADAGDWLQGAAKAFTKAVVGCVGGAVGYDTILEILERRISYMAFVKWLAGRVGWGLAISCASGAATAVLGW